MQYTDENRYIRLKKTRMKNKKKFKKKHRGIKFVIILVLSTATFILLALSPLFNIVYIEVRGNKHYTSEDIINASDITIGNNGFKTIGADILDVVLLRNGKAEKAILESCPYIKNVSVRFVLPNKMLVTVNEREPVYVAPYMGVNLLMDNEGYILDTVNNPQETGLPIVEGLRGEYYKLGQAFKVDNPESLKAVITLIKAIMEYDKEDGFKLFEHITSIDVSDLSKVFILLDSRITVNLGDLQDLKYKIVFLKHIYFKNLKKDDKGLLDFTNGKSPIFIPSK